MQSPSKLVRHVSWSIVAVLALHTSLASSEMIGPEAAMPSHAPSQADVDRAKVQQFLDRASVKERLQAMGVGALNARDRVGALSQEEVHALAQRIDSMPAGGSLSEMDMILILLVALVVLVAL
ncbi:MAG TPA: PA2779 family protein [Ramlibacter sp.]|nr:PA2779 family protein [Ramlibacter sp.]